MSVSNRCRSSETTEHLSRLDKVHAQWNALLSFLSPSALEDTGSHLTTGLPHPPCCTHRFSQPFDALLPPRPFRIYFAPVTLLGFVPFRGFPPPHAERLSAGHPLLALRCFQRRLQGFERAVDPYSHSKAREGFRAADPLLGFHLSRVFSPSATARAFTRPAFMHFPLRLPEGERYLVLQGIDR